MSRQVKYKPCGRCGAGKVMTGERSMFNAKDKSGKIICSDCRLADILAPFVKRT